MRVREITYRLTLGRPTASISEVDWAERPNNGPNRPSVHRWPYFGPQKTVSPSELLVSSFVSSPCRSLFISE